MDWDLVAANYYQTLEWLAVVVALVIFVSSLDDLFIDIWYWVRRGWRGLRVQRSPRYSKLMERHILMMKDRGFKQAEIEDALAG